MLHKMAFDLLATPASSLACERQFSIAGHVLNEERWQTKADYAEAYQLLKNWFQNKLISNSEVRATVRADNDDSGDNIDSELLSEYSGNSLQNSL